MNEFSIEKFRALRKACALRPLENLQDSSKNKYILAADKVMANGWTRRGYPKIDLGGEIPWEVSVLTSRSWSFYLHSWDMLHDLLNAYYLTEERKYFDFSLRIALDWINHYINISTDSAFAWFDMAVGLRVCRLSFLLDVSARIDDVPNGVVQNLLDAIFCHRDDLADDRKIAFHSNHGFYQVVGQLAMASRFFELPRMMLAKQQALVRLEHMINLQFTKEGIHKEHSPDYHRMVSETLCKVLDLGLINDSELLSFAIKIEANLAWFVKPNGYLTNFGDTDHRQMIRGTASALRWRSFAMQFVVSGGDIGIPPDSSMAVFPESGYFIVRSHWLNNSNFFSHCSYLAQTLCFHSRTHKHADDLSFIWYDRGHEILVDAGRYGYLEKTKAGSDLWKLGYWYADPNRMYVEDTRAHNAVEIDGISNPRHKVKPYGSALQRWGETKQGIFFSESHVYQFKTIRHARVLVFNPGEWLFVFDWLWDNLKKPHDFRQWFQFAPSLHPEKQGSQVLVRMPQSCENLRVVSLLQGANLSEVIVGRSLPQMQGWWSPCERKMDPIASVAFEKENSFTAIFATLFSFTDEIFPDFLSSNVDIHGRKQHYIWNTRDKRCELDISRPREGSMDVEYKSICNKLSK